MAQAAGTVEAARYERSVLWEWLTTVDHKKIGVLYLFTALTYFVLGGIGALLIRLQLAVPGGTVLGPDTYNQMFTMHGTIMIFLAVMPLNAALFNFFIPLMIGARDVAFPRLNAFSYWTFLFGSLLLMSSFLFGAAPNVGWTGYANLTLLPYSPGLNVDFWIWGLQILGVSTLAAAFNFFVTIVNMRAPGMRMMRMPLFVWNTFVTQILIIFAFPALTIALILLTFDRYFGTVFFDPNAGGGDVVLWQHLFWIFGHPEVYILILPAFGIVSEILPVFARKPLFGYPFVVYATVAIGFLSFGVWVHHMFTVGHGSIVNAVFATTTMVIAIPTGVKIFNWLGTLWGGAISLTTPMLFATAFVGMFTIGGISGVMHASVPVDYWQHDTYFVVAHFHYVLFGGSMLAIFGGIYYWFPKMFGRMLNETLGKIHFWTVLIGFNLTFFPMHFLGVDGMPRRIFTYPEGMGWDLWNMVQTVGAFLTAAGVLVFLYNIFLALKSGERAPADPWDGRTLEWSIPSPPPVYNFAKVPEVKSRDPLWEEKHGSGASAGSETNLNPPPGAESSIHLPPPSIIPLIVSFSLLLMGAGMLMVRAEFAIAPVIVVAGLMLLTVSLYAWFFEPNH